MDPEINLGIAPDPRSDAEKIKDFQHADIAGDIMVNWVEKPQSAWKKYTPREQDGSLSCCGQGSAKAVEILNKTVMSAHPIYRSRANYPSGGMYLQNVGEIWKKIGSTTEALDASQFQNETIINREITVVTPTKTNGYIFINTKDIDQVAQAIELYKHCIMIVRCNSKEWTAIPEYNGGDLNFFHCICGVDYTLYQGKKAIIIEDSTGHFNSLPPLKDGTRIITEDFLVKRFSQGMYLTATIPYIFTKLLKFGMNNSDVSELQNKLKALGYFPQAQTITTYFGNITLKAVKVFQSANNLVADGVVGKLTNEKLNSV